MATILDIKGVSVAIGIRWVPDRDAKRDKAWSYRVKAGKRETAVSGLCPAIRELSNKTKLVAGLLAVSRHSESGVLAMRLENGSWWTGAWRNGIPLPGSDTVSSLLGSAMIDRLASISGSPLILTNDPVELAKANATTSNLKSQEISLVNAIGHASSQIVMEQRPDPRARAVKSSVFVAALLGLGGTLLVIHQRAEEQRRELEEQQKRLLAMQEEAKRPKPAELYVQALASRLSQDGYVAANFAKSVYQAASGALNRDGWRLTAIECKPGTRSERDWTPICRKIVARDAFAPELPNQPVGMANLNGSVVPLVVTSERLVVIPKLDAVREGLDGSSAWATMRAVIREALEAGAEAVRLDDGKPLNDLKAPSTVPFDVNVAEWKLGGTFGEYEALYKLPPYAVIRSLTITLGDRPTFDASGVFYYSADRKVSK